MVARSRVRRVVSSVRASRESGERVGGSAMGSCWDELGVGIFWGWRWWVVGPIRDGKGGVLLVILGWRSWMLDG